MVTQDGFQSIWRRVLCSRRRKAIPSWRNGPEKAGTSPPNGLCLGRNSNSGQTSNSSEMGHRVTRGQSMTSLAVPLWEKAGKWSLSIIFLTSHWSGGCLQKGGNGWPALWCRTPECAPNCRIWILGWTAFKRTNEILAWTLKGNYGIIFSCGHRNWWAQNGERCNY